MEYYPELATILELLGEDCILVGSATVNPTGCKDYDFVINKTGWHKLEGYDYYLYNEDFNWKQYIPLKSTDKCVDFFYGICNIQDVNKHGKRITFDEASQRDLKLVQIKGIQVLSI